MQKQQNSILEKIRKLALNVEEIEVLWLYGSQAKNTMNSTSDFDLAVAFSDLKFEKLAYNYPCDELAYHWSNATGESISVIDINNVPVPLAYSVIQHGKILECKNDLRLHSEMQRIWSLWEHYRYEHRKQRK